MNDILINAGTFAVRKTFVLVHAAWQAPYAWEKVKALLLNDGYQVTSIQLPGHGEDHTDHKTLHMDSYITDVTEKITAIGTRVILVGHSLAGMTISGVAEQIPNLIEKLVYVAAYVPASGQSAYALSLPDKQSLLGASLLVSEDQSEFDIKQEDIVNIFCQGASDDVQQLILENYRPEPAAPFSDPVFLSDGNFGRIAKYYIETLQDHGIGNDLQKEMIAAAAITNVYTLNTGHSPSLSMPEEVSDILKKIALL
ncbi:alpha/beta fold hydrolase [Pedobacter hartonius]|uniref:Alpha/beta hydrolase family protein n=1 Tax=Pedobacter hartonius TaxID=425514 RepID=A0A1H4GCH3_9SPHI|nr:alpha/beta fold hydrolase [Pedobacter hartonius]SEB06608.1 Alpha/beta hydrolase family protein [Pedobacter hartonius]